MRSNRLVLARLDAFAHDLFAFLATGAPSSDAEAPSLPQQAPVRMVRNGVR